MKTLILCLACCLPSVILFSQLCDPPATNCCEDAPILCSVGEMNGYTCRNPPPPNTCGPSTLCPNGGVPNNMSWWGFVAGSNFISLRITPSNCTTVPPSFVGIQAGIYSDCTFANSIDCQGICQTGPFIIGGNTIPCETYYVFIDGCAGSECDYTVEVLSGSNPPDLKGRLSFTVPDTVCVYEEFTIFTNIDSLSQCKTDVIALVGNKTIGTGETF